MVSCVAFSVVFRSCWANLARALSVPGRSFALVASNCTAKGYEPVCALLKCAFVSIFLAFLCFFPRRFEHGRFSRKGGRDMAAKIPTTFAASCNRPSALWASQLSLLSCSLLSTFVLHFSPFSLFFFNFSSFHLSLFPSFLLFPFFPQVSSIFPSLPLIFCFFPCFSAKATRLSVTSLPTLCPARHLTQANAACCESAFLHISRHFWAYPKNEGPIWRNAKKGRSSRSRN